MKGFTGIRAVWILVMALAIAGTSCATRQGATLIKNNEQRQVRVFSEPPAVGTTSIQAAYGLLPLYFEVNQGQTHSQVRFLSRGSRSSLFLTASAEAVLVLDSVPFLAAHRELPATKDAPAQATHTLDPAVLRMSFVGANSTPRVVGLSALPGKSHHFIGNEPRKWRTDIPTYAKVHYDNVYPGIDLVYYGNQRQLEYDFIVAPGADPRVITLAFAGADHLAVESQGDLVLQIGGGQIRLRTPR
jgi:hypothetical protein